MSAFSWLGFLFSSACAVAMIVALAIYAKRIGGAGPWLLMTIPLFDVMMRVAFRLTSMTMRHGASSFAQLEATYDALEIVDLMLTLISTAIVVLGVALMRKPRLA
jgi:hypothetical protein